LINDQSAYIIQKVFKMLYFEGYSIPEVVNDPYCSSIVDKMVQIKKINSVMFGMLKERIEENRKAKL
jgi:hypothetical protein